MTDLDLLIISAIGNLVLSALYIRERSRNIRKERYLEHKNSMAYAALDRAIETWGTETSGAHSLEFMKLKSLTSILKDKHDTSR